jgi:hypothetical protein
MRIEMVRDYVAVRTEDRTAIHHARGADGRIVTRIVRDGSVLLEAGLTLSGIFG